MPASKQRTARVAAWLLAMLTLLLPAIWNGFPLLEYDTGGYLARFFEGTLAPSRSTTYGFLLLAGSPLDFWPVVILQAAASVWIVGAVLKTCRFNLYPAGLSAATVALAVTTALPWLASELITDIFAGLAVLAMHTLIRHGDALGSRQRAALTVFAAFAASTHSATYAVLLALGLAAAIVWLLDRRLIPIATIARAAAVVILGAVMLLAGNYIVAKRIEWTPGGYGIVFARMLQDGIVTRYLNEHCPDARLKLCPYRDQLPRDADEFLWDGPIFDKLGRFSGLGDEMRMIVLESLRDYPATQIEAALVATGKQLVAVGTGEGIVADTWHTHWIIGQYTPWAEPAMNAARQKKDEISFTAINVFQEPVAWTAMALLPLIALLGLRRTEFSDVGRLSATVALALLANAVICGVISNPHDRYGSRIVWIAVFTAILTVWRWFNLPRRQTAPSAAEVL